MMHLYIKSPDGLILAPSPYLSLLFCDIIQS